MNTLPTETAKDSMPGSDGESSNNGTQSEPEVDTHWNNPCMCKLEGTCYKKWKQHFKLKNKDMKKIKHKKEKMKGPKHWKHKLCDDGRLGFHGFPRGFCAQRIRPPFLPPSFSPCHRPRGIFNSFPVFPPDHHHNKTDLQGADFALNLQYFKPEDVTVKIAGQRLKVKANHSSRDVDIDISGCDVSGVHTQLTENNVLLLFLDESQDNDQNAEQDKETEIETLDDMIDGEPIEMQTCTTEKDV